MFFYHHISPIQCHFQKFAGVSMKWTLHCHSIPTTPLPPWSGTAVLICIFATHFNTTSVTHSIATPMYSQSTPQCHSGVHTPLPPLQLSQYTPMPLRSVFKVLICIFTTHSNATTIKAFLSNDCVNLYSHWASSGVFCIVCVTPSVLSCTKYYRQRLPYKV